MVETCSFQVPARKNLLSILTAQETEWLEEGLVKQTQIWIEELVSLSERLDSPCIRLKERHNVRSEGLLKLLGRNDDCSVYKYTGQPPAGNGYWIEYQPQNQELFGAAIPWDHLHIKSMADLALTKEYGEFYELFLPEQFAIEKNKVKHHERHIYKFETPRGIVFAKENRYALNSDSPRHKDLRHIHGMHGLTSSTERKIFDDLTKKGIPTPTIVGHYAGPIESFLFFKQVPGNHPTVAALQNAELRREYIRQDAHMLATMLAAGYEKAFFEDFDDKIFDDNILWLIDADEVEEIYEQSASYALGALKDPRDLVAMKDFRLWQRNTFKNILKSTIASYDKTLLKTEESKAHYIRVFFNTMGWNCTERDLRIIADRGRPLFAPAKHNEEHHLMYERSKGYR